MNRLRAFGPTLLCFALILAQALWYWNRIPEHVTSHAGLNGEAVGSRSKEMFFAFEALLVFLTTGLFSLIASRLPQVKPELFNIPNKQYWLAPKRTQETIEFIQRRLRFMGTVAGLFTVLISQLVLDTNLSGHPLSQTTIVELVAGFAVVIAGFSISMAIRFSRVPKT
ncbi:MAG: DUF1648 domain-containing protein [Myxococcaceae bacterium]